MKALLYTALGIFMFVTYISIVGFSISMGISVAQEAYNLKGVLGDVLYFLGFDKKSILAGILAFIVSAGVVFVVCIAIAAIIQAVLMKLIDNIWLILGRSCLYFIAAPYCFGKAFIFYPIKCSFIIFKYFSWRIKILLTLAWIGILGALIFAFFYFNVADLLSYYFSKYYKELSHLKRLNYNYVFSIFIICVLVNIISLGTIFLLDKFETFLYMRAYKILKEQQRKNDEKYEDFSQNSYENTKDTNEEFDILLKIFDLTEATFNRENLKKNYRKLARKFHPDYAPLHRKKEAHEQFVELQNNYEKIQKYLKD